MHIGLVGGIGPAATDFYYRRLISAFARNKVALELTIAHADTPTLLKNLASNDAEDQVAIYMKLTHRLAAAGAECVAVTSIAALSVAAAEAWWTGSGARARMPRAPPGAVTVCGDRSRRQSAS